MKALYIQKHWRSFSILFSLVLFLSVIIKANDPSSSFAGWQTVGPSGGDTREIVIDPKDKNHLYVSTIDGQIYASYDAGKSWAMLVNFNRPQLILDQLSIDPRDSKTLYASGHRHKEAGGFFKTTDGGKTWKESKDLKNEAIHSMIQSTLDPNIILVGTINGVWESKDSGDNWKKLESASSPVNVDSLAIDPRDNNTIYAGTWWRAFKTTDGGKNWRAVSSGMIDDSDVFSVDIDPRNPDNVFASACSGIYYSSNKGEKWAKVQGIPSESRRTRDILQHPSVAGTVFAGTTEGLWITRDNGKTWALTTSRQLEVNSIAVAPEDPNKVYIATNNYGVMVSNDAGKNFVPNNGNLSTRLTYSIVADYERPDRLYATTINTATGGGFVFISDDDGKTWIPSTKNITVNRLMPFNILQDRKTPNTLYLGTNIGLYRSLDRGLSWAQVTASKKKRTPVKKRAARGKTAVREKAAAKATVDTAAAAIPAALKVPALTEKINALVYTEDGKNGLLAATNSGLYRTYDIAAGWEKIPFGEGINEQVFAVHTFAADPQAIWVGTGTSGVIVSKDGGATWQKVEGIRTTAPISAIMVNPKNPDYIYVGTKETFFMSQDGGQKWMRRGGNLPSGNYNSILVNPNNPNEVFVGSALDVNGSMSGGIFQSNDAGDTWKRLDTKDTVIPSRRVWAMTFDPKNPNRIFAGTHSAGIYKIERGGITAATADSENKENAVRPRTAVTEN